MEKIKAETWSRCKRYKTCKYRGAKYDPNHCDYALITGHLRGCDPGECDKYEEGERLTIPTEYKVQQIGKGVYIKELHREETDYYYGI